MDQIIIEHYNNSCNFLSLKNFKIPFIIKDGLDFQNEQIFFKAEIYERIYEGIKINKNIEGYWTFFYENGKKWQEGLYKSIKQDTNNYVEIKEDNCISLHEKEDYWISWYENGQKESEGNLKDGKKEDYWIYWNENGQKDLEGNYKDGKKMDFGFLGMES